MVYATFKFLHIAAVIVWIGGLVGVGILNARVAREHDASALASLHHASAFFGRSVGGPAAGVTLVAGIVMMASGGIRFATLWIVWGLAGILVSGILGGTLMRRASEELGEAVQAPQADQTRTATLQGRLRVLNLLNLLLLFSVVAAMVFKPTL